MQTLDNPQSTPLSEITKSLSHKNSTVRAADFGIAWHYTTSKALPQIMREGRLGLGQSSVYDRVWFSLEPYWEKQADATRWTDIGPIQLHSTGQIPLRFGMNTSKMCRGLNTVKPNMGKAFAQVAGLGSSGLFLGLGALLLTSVMTAHDKRNPNHEAERRAALRRVRRMHFYYPGPHIPLTEIEAIEKFDGEKWVDCKAEILAQVETLKAAVTI